MRRRLLISLWVCTAAMACQREQAPGAHQGARAVPRANTPAEQPAASVPSDRPPGAASDAAVLAPAATGNYPVKWWSGLDLPSAAQASARYTANEPELFGELEHAGSRAQPASCKQWAELHAQQYEAVDGLAEQTDRGAKLRCATLQLIEHAKPARISYVRDLRWDHSLLGLLPAAIATVVNEEGQRIVEAASAAGKSFKQLQPKAQLRPSTDQDTLEIVEAGKQMMIVLYPQAWGDFDGDGLDDVAVTVVNGAVHGTLSYSRLLTFTRSGPREPLQLTASR
ncbi:MAG: hypothetical protein JWN04_3057 [Myxococcaceae bacterium]|nr:hypothetical protein [Myxococcaceae bacterium]